MGKFRTTWEFATPDQILHATAAIGAQQEHISIDVFTSGNDIYTVAEPGLVYGEGDPPSALPAGMLIKIVSSSCVADWVYMVGQLVVKLPGWHVASLKPGTRIAILPPNYRDLLRKEPNAVAPARGLAGADPP